jgi:hypothetical protein
MYPLISIGITEHGYTLTKYLEKDFGKGEKKVI